MGDIYKMNDKELLEKACELGLKTCPITPMTRKMIVSRIERAIKDPKNFNILSYANCDSSNPSKSDGYSNCLPIPTLESTVECKVDEFISDKILDGLSHDISNMHLQSTPNKIVSASSNQYFVVHSSQNSLIVHSLKEVTELAKVDPELRFKTFSNYNEAESSMISFQEEISKIQSIELEEPKPSLSIAKRGQLAPFKNWKSIPTKLLLKYRKYLENGDVKNVLLCCLNNPRYVITSIDTPVILHEGTRRNAFHIAAEKDQPQVISLLLGLLRNDMWCQACHLVPNNDNDTIEDILRNNHYRDYTSHTLDLYLNSPDKILFETPLHIACKFGSKEIVRMLLTQPGINKYPKNKYGETPYDLIGSRCNTDNYDDMLESVQSLFRNTSF